jgi:RNA-directed DNA polymerase
MGKPRNRTMLEPKFSPAHHGSGGRKASEQGDNRYKSPGCLIRHSTQSAGKPRTLGKDLTGVRSSQRKLVPDTVGPEKDKPTSLRGIANRARAHKHHRFRDLYRCLNADFLRDCWNDLNKNASSGVDGITAGEYEENLEANLRDLVERLKKKRYRTKLVRRSYIPKENGKERPLGIPALEDKLVQRACAELLSAIYEEDFVEGSYGYRPKRSAGDAIMDLTFNLQFGKFGYVVEADIKGFFDHMDHDWLLKMLRLRIDDRAFLNLIHKWLKAGILETDGQVVYPDTGTPQGGSVSPVLANIYLHYVLDLWFKLVVKSHSSGDMLIIRFADDFVCAFRYKEDAERFYRELPKRLEKFGLTVAADKTRLLRFSRFHPGMKQRFTFLGFELYWFADRQGEPRVMRRTAPKKLQAACRRIKAWIKENRHLKGRQFVIALNRRLRGHYNYYGLRGNSRSLSRFFNWTIACAFKWLNRRGGKRRSFTWYAFTRALKRLGVAYPRVTAQKRRHVVFA